MLLKINYAEYIPDDELVIYAHARFDAKGVLEAIEELVPGTDFMDYLSDDELNEIDNGYIEPLPGLVAGTAGYSPWSEYITLENMGNYARDMWDGYNFYDLYIYDGTECIESLWSGYLPSEEDWEDIVNQFDITGIIKGQDDYILEHLPRYEIRPSA